MQEAPPCVLVVEDDEDIRSGVVELLREWGYEVIEARNGLEGLEALRGRRDVGLVVLDLMMPDMNGATFRWRQLCDPRIASVPVLVLSSVQDGSKSAQVLRATRYLPKPFHPDALLHAVRATYAAPPPRGRKRARSGGRP